MKIQIANVPPHPIPLPRGERVVVGEIYLNIPSPLTGEGEGGGEHDLIPPTSILPRKGGGGLWECSLRNPRGISVLFLVIAMMLMVTIGYVFSYLIPTKQKSASLVVSSNQAFFLAQSGVEFAVRYATDPVRSWTTPAQLNGLDGMTGNLGRGRFTLDYNDVNDSLTSIGEVPNASQRRIVVSCFTSFLTKGLILDPASPVPCWTTPNLRARFFIKNVSCSITINAFYATWTQTGSTRIREIYMNGVQKFFGNYQTGDPIQSFNRGGNSQTILPNQVIQVEVVYDPPGKTIPTVTSIVITLYSTTGTDYAFDLDPENDGLPGC